MARDGESRSYRRKFCKLCFDKVDRIDYKDDRRLSRFITDRGKIVPRRAEAERRSPAPQRTATKKSCEGSLMPDA